MSTNYEQVVEYMNSLCEKERLSFDGAFSGILRTFHERDYKVLYTKLYTLIFKIFDITRVGDPEGDVKENLDELYEQFDNILLDAFRTRKSCEMIYNISHTLGLPNILYLTLFYCPEKFEYVFEMLHKHNLIPGQGIHLYTDRRFDWDIIKDSSTYTQSPLSEATKNHIRKLVSDFPDYIFKSSVGNLLSLTTYTTDVEEKMCYLRFISDLFECGYIPSKLLLSYYDKNCDDFDETTRAEWLKLRNSIRS